LKPNRCFGKFKSYINGNGIADIYPRLKDREIAGWRNKGATLALADVNIIGVSETKFVIYFSDCGILIMIYKISDSIVAPGYDPKSASPEDRNLIHL
jgi:hypothetical protein